MKKVTTITLVTLLALPVFTSTLKDDLTSTTQLIDKSEVVIPSDRK